jgi:hypothetical protein
MTTVQAFCLLSTILFVMFGVMINSNNAVGMLLKSGAILMAIFGALVTAGVFGFVVANGIRLI